MDLVHWLSRLVTSDQVKTKRDLCIDRLHGKLTVTALLMCCLAVSSVQYSSDPLTCWVPAQFTKNYEAFTNRLCWIKNTYHSVLSPPNTGAATVKRHQPSAQQRTKRPQRHSTKLAVGEPVERHEPVVYYQWINFILVMQAMMFFLPKLIWEWKVSDPRLPIAHCLMLCGRYDKMKMSKDRYLVERNILCVVNEVHSHRALTATDNMRGPQNKNNGKCSPRSPWTYIALGCFWRNIFAWYTFTRILQFLVVAGQFLILSKLLGFNYLLFGLSFFQQAMTANEPLRAGQTEHENESRYFPKITMCDFTVKELGISHHYTVECVLTINTFVEKIYIVMWCWFVLLALLSFQQFLELVFRISYVGRIKMLRRTLLVAGELSDECLAQFVRWLGTDTFFLLWLISLNASTLLTETIFVHLYDRFAGSRLLRA